jgi:hypothetical protein
MLKHDQELLSGLTELFAGIDVELAICVDDVFEFLEDLGLLFTKP